MRARRWPLVQTALGCLASGLGANPQQPPAPIQERPSVLKALSHELTNLRNTAEFRVRVDRGSELPSVPGAYLGEGVVATPFVEGLEPGAVATLRCQSGAYRLLSMQSSQSRWVSYFKLRDWPVDPAPPLPPLPSLADGSVTDTGDLVLVVGSTQARLALLERFDLGPRRPDRSSRRGAGRAAESPRQQIPVFGIADSESPPGSIVLGVDGEFLGLLVRVSMPSRGARSPEARKTGPGKTEEGGAKPADATRPPRTMTLVLSGSRLLDRGREAIAAKTAVRPKPQLGVSMVEMWRRQRRPRGDEEAAKTPREPGLLVTSVCVGSPAARAGVKPQDVWLTLGGKPLVSTDQVVAATARLKDGEALSLSFRRGAETQTINLRAD
jgi:hypothetical protein